MEKKTVKKVKQPQEKKPSRPPIIAIMGHVDHGKTTLMDYIQKSNIAQKEVGGITQSIRAFHVPYKETSMTFIDTPGHEAFSQMRYRGSNVADIILLVVAADDGVKPQTKEVIDLALNEKTPMVVAINKTDLPTADVTKVKTELAQHGVMLEGWGGDTVAVEISAKTGKGVDSLLDILSIVAEMEELHASDDTSRNEAVVLESYMQKNAGPESLVIVKTGRFEVGNFVVGESYYGKIRALIDDVGTRVTTAGTSMPIRILGLEKVLKSGEAIIAAADKNALHAIEKIEETSPIVAASSEDMQKSAVELLDELMNKTQAQSTRPTLNIVLKVDFVGSLEAIISSLENNANEHVDIKVIKSGTGEVNEADITFAKSARAVVIAFNVSIPSRIKVLAQKEKVILMSYSIIYELIEDVVTVAESLIPPEAIEVFIGSAEIIDTFKLSNGNYVAGSIVKEGKMVRGYNCYITRGKERIYEGKITSIRHFKDEIKEAVKGNDCGISTMPNVEFSTGDKITCIRIEKS